MSLRERLEQFVSTEHQQKNQQQFPVVAPAVGFRPTRWGIVDNEVVEILSEREQAGMSLVNICADPITGIQAPVPLTQVRSFATAGQAYAALAQQRGIQGGYSNISVTSGNPGYQGMSSGSPIR